MCVCVCVCVCICVCNVNIIFVLVGSEQTIATDTINLSDWLTAIQNAMNVHRGSDMLVQVRGSDCFTVLLKSIPEMKDNSHWLQQQISQSTHAMMHALRINCVRVCVCMSMRVCCVSIMLLVMY